MGFIKLNCPNCGAIIQLNADKEFGFCSYCGTKVVQDKIVIEHRGQISVDGIRNTNPFLERAFLFLEDGDFVNAAVYLEKVLDINPRCARAYIGKLLCQLRYRRIELLNTCQKPLDCFDLYNKAIRFATPNELKEYQGYNEKTKQNYKKEFNKKQSQIRYSINDVSNLNQYLETNKQEFIKTQAKRILRIILLIIGASGTFLSLLFLLMFSFDDERNIAIIIFIAFAFLWFLAFLIFMIMQVIKANRFINNYNESKVRLELLNQELSEIQNRFVSWNTSMLQHQ